MRIRNVNCNPSWTKQPIALKADLKANWEQTEPSENKTSKHLSITLNRQVCLHEWGNWRKVDCVLRWQADSPKVYDAAANEGHNKNYYYLIAIGKATCLINVSWECPSTRGSAIVRMKTEVFSLHAYVYSDWSDLTLARTCYLSSTTVCLWSTRQSSATRSRSPLQFFTICIRHNATSTFSLIHGDNRSAPNTRLFRHATGKSPVK